MVVVDNFNLVTKQRGCGDTEWENILSARFMDFAKEKGVAIIVIHHLNKDGSMRGSEKIRDNATGTFSCFRETEALDKLPEFDKRHFILTEKKDREFGRPGVFSYYFVGGTFVDSDKKCIEYLKANNLINK